MPESTIRRFDRPDETRLLKKGRLDIVHIGGMTIARATYQPGWHWKKHVAPEAETDSCEVEHVGLVLKGTVAVRMDDGTQHELAAGDLFFIPPGHDSWVIGDGEYMSLHFTGGDSYFKSADS